MGEWPRKWKTPHFRRQGVLVPDVQKVTLRKLSYFK